MKILEKIFPKNKPFEQTYVVTLKRLVENDNGTFGVLIKDNMILCLTCEDKWRDNQKSVSCIPKGEYVVKKHNGAKFKNVWILENVPNREAILIHEGNTEDSTSGCILCGMSPGTLNGKKAILRSKEAMDMLRKTLPNNFLLRVE